MKGILVILFCATQSIVFSHDYFFAFAEVDYDDITQQFEATLVVSSHDLDHVLREQNYSVDSIATMKEDSQLYSELQQLVSTHFRVSSGTTNCEFILVGAELLFNGVVEIYLTSVPIEVNQNLTFSFDLLMKDYPQQQNKLTLYYRNQTYNATFMRDTRTQQILLENS